MLRGREIYYCNDCGWVFAKRGFTGACPKCARPLYNLTCSRCNHMWRSKTGAAPKICPKCKSPYWNRARNPKVPKKDISFKDTEVDMDDDY